MADLTAFFILIVSFAGLVFLISRKLPALADLPEAPAMPASRENLIDIKEGKPFSKNISLNNVLQRFLARIRILILKTDNKTSTWLTRLREKSRHKNQAAEEDNYWQEIKKSAKK